MVECFADAGPGQFSCKDGPLISASWLCDGIADCEDVSDETTEKCRKCNKTTMPGNHNSVRLPGLTGLEVNSS